MRNRAYEGSRAIPGLFRTGQKHQPLFPAPHCDDNSGQQGLLKYPNENFRWVEEHDDGEGLQKVLELHFPRGASTHTATFTGGEGAFDFVWRDCPSPCSGVGVNTNLRSESDNFVSFVFLFLIPTQQLKNRLEIS